MRTAQRLLLFLFVVSGLPSFAQVPSTGKALVVDLKRQTLTGYLDGQPKFAYNVVTGKKSTPTRPGSFRVVRKERFWVSKQYGSRMDYALFFDGGRAIHEAAQVELLHKLKLEKQAAGVAEAESIGSHGCVRLEPVQAKEVFEWTPLRTPVIVVEGGGEANEPEEPRGKPDA